MADLHALDIARALQPAYEPGSDLQETARRAVARLGTLVGAPVRLELPDALGVGPIGDALQAGWSVEFVHDGARGRLSGSGAGPGEEAEKALRTELERFCAYVALLRGIASVFDRLQFRLRALHQIARTLNVSRETKETHVLVADFTREMFFAWWVALYRPRGDGTLEAVIVHALRGQSAPPRIRADRLARLFPVAPESRAAPVSELPDWMPTEARAVAVLDAGGQRVGCLMLGERMNGEPYGEEDLQLLGTLAHASAIAIQNAELVERLREQTIQDDLTGLYNRRYFDARLNDELGRARRYARPLSLLLLDLDDFKAYNDRYGHTAGDALLSRVGALVRADIRKVDVACRYGGEEFAVIVPETGPSGARILADRLHAAVVGVKVAGGLTSPVTVSIGIASFPEHAQEPGPLVEAADKALYRAKAEGRNRVVAAERLSDP